MNFIGILVVLFLTQLAEFANGLVVRIFAPLRRETNVYHMGRLLFKLEAGESRETKIDHICNLCVDYNSRTHMNCLQTAKNATMVFQEMSEAQIRDDPSNGRCADSFKNVRYNCGPDTDVKNVKVYNTKKIRELKNFLATECRFPTTSTVLKINGLYVDDVSVYPSDYKIETSSMIEIVWSIYLLVCLFLVVIVILNKKLRVCSMNCLFIITRIYIAISHMLNIFTLADISDKCLFLSYKFENTSQWKILWYFLFIAVLLNVIHGFINICVYFVGKFLVNCTICIAFFSIFALSLLSVSISSLIWSKNLVDEHQKRMFAAYLIIASFITAAGVLIHVILFWVVDISRRCFMMDKKQDDEECLIVEIENIKF